MATQTFEQALNEALNSAKVSYSENRELHTMHNGLIYYSHSYVNKQVKISRQLLDRLNEIERQYNLTYDQQDKLDYHISYAWQDVLICRAEWERMYRATRLEVKRRLEEQRRRLEEQRRRRREEQQIQLRRTRHGRNLTERHKTRDRFIEAFRRIPPEQLQAILRRADNQRADNQREDDNANFH